MPEGVLGTGMRAGVQRTLLLSQTQTKQEEEEQQTPGPVGSSKGTCDLLISQKPEEAGLPKTGLRAEHVPKGDQEAGLQHHPPEQGLWSRVKLSPLLP